MGNIENDIIKVNSSPWNLALDALDYHKNTFRYFALQNPPDKDPSGETQPKNNQKGESITNKNYFQVQNLIEQQINYLSNFYGKIFGKEKIGDLTRIYDFIIQKIQKMYDIAYQQENNLYESLLPQIAETGIHYANFINNTPVNKKNVINGLPYISYKEKNLSDKAIRYDKMTSIELWTRAANNALEYDDSNSKGFAYYFDSAEDADLYAFTRIVGSYTFYEALKSKLEPQIFTRTGAYKKANISPETLTDKISFEAIEQLVKDFNDDLGGESIFDFGKMPFRIKNIINPLYIKNKMVEGLADALKTYYTGIELINSNGRMKINISAQMRKEQKKQDVSAKAASELIRNKLSNVIDNCIEIYKGKDNKNYQDKLDFGMNFSIKISDGYSGNYFIVNSKKYGDGSKLYKISKETYKQLRNKAGNMNEQEFSEYLSENPNISKELIIAVFKTFEESLESFNEAELNMMGLGTMNINNFISKCYIWNGKTNILYFKSQRDFYNKAKKFTQLIQKALNKFFGKGHGIKELWKSFKIANSNAFLSGLFGELAALGDINRIFKRYGFMTGSYSSMLGYGDTAHTVGQNVNDIRNVYKTGMQDKTGRTISRSVGANVKHYVGAKNEIILYPSKNNDGLSIYNGGMDKYLGKEDTDMLRFITSNSGYFKSEQIIKQIGITIAGLHLSQFYRAVDFTRGSALNLFYELNNVIYPLTYIYQTMINELEAAKKDINRSLLDVKLVGKKENKPPMYKNVEEAKEKWKDKDWRIATRGKGELDMRIKTKGLKINLVSLNLFQ